MKYPLFPARFVSRVPHVSAALFWGAVTIACGTTHADEAGFRFTDRIQADLPETTFILLPAAAQNQNQSDDAPPRDIGAIRIEQDGRTIQTIDGFTASPIIDGDTLEGFVVEDLNFDGYKDLRLIEFLPAGPNIPYLVWLYDPAAKRHAASDLFANLTGFEVDAENQEIVSSWRDGAAKNGTSYYKFEGGRLSLVREESRSYETESRYRLILRERREGQMVEVKNEMVDVETPEG